jgi:hypothetical protein
MNKTNIETALTKTETELLHAYQTFEAEIIRLYRFGHEAQADAMFETTAKAFRLNRETFNTTITKALAAAGVKLAALNAFGDRVR